MAIVEPESRRADKNGPIVSVLAFLEEFRHRHLKLVRNF